MIQFIFQTLRAEVDRARAEYTQAKEAFWRISAEVPTGLPHSDAGQRIEAASRAQTTAMIAYTKALRRFNEFLLNGTVPDDLQSRDKAAASGSSSQ